MANQDQLALLRNGVTEWNQWRRENPGIQPDLDGAILPQAFLRGADLRDANLFGANLEKAALEGANLDNARISGNFLIIGQAEKRARANLSGARLNGASLRSTNLSHANLRGASFEKATMTGAWLSSSDLTEADLSGAEMTEADLVATNLHDAFMVRATLRRANLQGADLTGAMLTRADFRGADLRSANLDGAVVVNLRYDRWARYTGIRVANCIGGPRFRRFAQDQEFIEEFRSSRWRWPAYALWLIFADCGRSLYLWALWCLLFALAFACVYLSLGESCFEHRLPWGFGTAVYYSVVTFTTLGFGDITPKTLEAAYWVTAEVVVGYIMLGGLISILSTQLARRS